MIASVETVPFRLPLKGEFSWGRGSKLRALEHVLVRVTLDSGHFGVAEAQPRPSVYGETLQSIAAIVKYHLGPKLLGIDVDDKATIEAALGSVVNNNTARAALDIAILQARARSKGRRLFDTYRGPQERVRASFILGIADVKGMIAEARRVFEAGVSVFKLKVGRDLSHDEEVLRALDAEFRGTNVIVYGDANERLEPKTVTEQLERYAAWGLSYIEAPLPVEHFKARAELCAEHLMDIVADESCFTLRDLRRELELKTFDVLNVKPARSGYSESLKMLRLVREADRCAMIGSQASSGLGTLYSAILASKEGVTHPCELAFPLKLERDIVSQDFRYEGGYLDVAPLETMVLDEDKLTAAAFAMPPL